MRTAFLLSALLAAGLTMAAEEELPDAPPPDLLPPKVLDSNARLEPTVTITRGEEGQIIEEYRAPDGQLFMVKITPENAPPYYLYDMDGDGEFQSDIESDPGVSPVYWKLKEWR